MHQQRQLFSQTFRVFTITDGAVAVDVKRGGKTAGKREITFNFYLQATQVACAILGLKDH